MYNSITIITVVYNGEKHIEDTILSILNHSSVTVEYIVIDGGSTDNTLNILNKYKEFIAVLVSEPDNGIYDAMNKGISLASNDIIGIINSDDFYFDNVLSDVLFVFNENDIDIVYGNMLLIDENEIHCKIIYPSESGLRNYMSLNHPTCFVKKACYLNSKYDLRYKLLSDYDLYLRFKVLKYKFCYINKTLAGMRMGGASSNFLLTRLECYNIHKIHYGILYAATYFISSLCYRLLSLIIRAIIPNSYYLNLKGFNSEYSSGRKSR